ncbi:MAG: hypothetical protein EBT97_12815, partial [Actinobacteria bacterium]|nr:hypothetical protein [Actinomycetota bacterium]
MGQIWGAAMAPDGSLWLADSSRSVLRRVAPAQLFPAIATASVGIAEAPVVAGILDEAGLADGSALAARFAYPMGLAFDGTDLLVADRDNDLVRKVVGAG